MATKILAFDADCYLRQGTLRNGDEFLGDLSEFKNIVGLDDMTPKERYELALADDETAFIYDTIEEFTEALNDEWLESTNYWIYPYQED